MKEKSKKKIAKGEKSSHSKINRNKVFIALIIIAAIGYILYAVLLLNADGTDTFFVEQGTIHEEESVLGYIIRNEKVIKNEEYQNGIVQIAGEGEKVHKDEAIFQYYSDETKEISKKIDEIDLQIQEQLKDKKIASNSDIKLIENQIESQLETLRKLNNIQEITEYSKTIKNLLEKKISTLGEITGTTNELKQLINERNSLSQQIRNSTKYLTAPISGVVSYRVDNLEDELTTEDFNKLTTAYLENLNLKTGQIIATSGEAGKVIDNFIYYIATSVDSTEAMNAKIGDKVTIRLSTNDEIKSEIAHINEEENRRVLILKIDRMTEKLINYRKISFELIWWSDSGLKVPNKAIIEDEKGLSYLIRTGSNMTKLLVKIVNKNENYSIVSPYSTEELTELGLSQDEIKSYKKIKLYDEILLFPSQENLK